MGEKQAWSHLNAQIRWHWEESLGQIGAHLRSSLSQKRLCSQRRSQKHCLQILPFTKLQSIYNQISAERQRHGISCVSSLDGGSSFLNVGCEAPSETTLAALPQVNFVVIVRILMSIWPCFSLSGRKCGKPMREGSCCYPGFLKKDDFFSIAICFLLRGAERFWLINDLVQHGWAAHIMHLADSSFHSCVCAQLLQLCPTLCDPMDCSPPGSSVHGILQARILEWVAMPSFRGASSFMTPPLQAYSLPLATPGKPFFHSYLGDICGF